METFVLQYELLRWGMLAGFVVTAATVIRRVARAGPECAAGRAVPVVDRHSDAAHLLMCLVMAAMLMFPLRADPAALRGVLTAMTVVYGVLLTTRIMHRHNGNGDVHRVTAIGYHLAAAAAMLLAVSGTHAGHAMGHTPGAPPSVLVTLAAVFAADAVLMAVPASGELRRRLVPHGPAGGGPVIPHMVMDLGTAYMLVAAAIG
ncbi:DUF5134 domain-containing protein [Nocardia stercoris]|uniref:DUF5134 domain-containing protein n=1 Tax=Nocardia stercoris TaxID=2483361 RepID=UPI00131A42AA|nr:DUF5134 domain-containing protein [Nocardia stercoris]